MSVALVGALTLAANATTAIASSPAAVHFDVPTTFGGPNLFTATGPAVDGGSVCASGEAIDLFNRASGFESGVGVNFQVLKEFVCNDGSGSFFVKLQVRLDFRRGTDNFSWVIVDGTGSYENMHGSGSGVGIDQGPDFVRDVYDGRVHIT